MKESPRLDEPREGASMLAGVYGTPDNFGGEAGAFAMRPPPVYSFRPVETSIFAAVAARETLPKITTVVAPPGYGKTVFLSELYRKYQEAGVQCLWIALDDRDRALGSLLRLLEAAVGFQPAEGHIYEKFSRSDTFERIENIRLRLAAGLRPTILFIDNIDFCKEAGVDTVLNALVFNSPDWFKLFVSSSSTPVPFNAGRAHLELNLQTIKAADLSFDKKATAELFDDAGLTDLDSAALAEIVDRTEGWPAAIRLLQLTAQAGNAVNGGIELLVGHEEHISDILSERLIASFPDGLVNFLYEIAEFRHFSAELAEIATGNPQSATWIQFLVDHNIMIIPVDQKRRWFRFHTLFRQYLIEEARRKCPTSRRREIHANAARWLIRQGDQSSAFDLAIAAGNSELIAEILERAACSLVREQGDTSTFIEWIKRASEAGVKRGPLATFWYAWALLFERRFAEASDEIRAAYVEIAKVEDCPTAKALRSKLAIAEIAASIHLDATDSAIKVAEQWLEQNPDGEPFEIGVAAAGGLGIARFSKQEYTTARFSIQIAQAAISRSDSIYGRCWVAAVDAIREIIQGDPAAAVREMAALDGAARMQIGPNSSILSVLAIVRARGLLEAGEFAEAEGLLAEHLDRAAANGVPDTTWAGLEVAIASVVSGRAVFTLDELRSIVKTYPKRIGVLFELKLIRELAESGQADTAIDRAEEWGWSVKRGWPESLLTNASEMEQSAARMTGGALLLACGHFSAAHELFQQEIRRAVETGRRLDQVELFLSSVDACFRIDARTTALRAFTRAIMLTTKREIYRPYLKRQKLMAFIHENSKPKELGLTNMDELGTLAHILGLSGLQKGALGSTSKNGEGVVAPPTPREIELLHYLEAGLDNSQIAERLSVSIRTIKWHLSNLYFKLDVKNRSAAVAKGRALRLLP
jgi:LuxR family maltose regulon positive regulatory protein